MRADGVERAVGIVMAPHWSGMSVETYIERVLAGRRRMATRARRSRSCGPITTILRSSRSWRLG